MAWNLAAFLTISTLKAEADLERIADYGNMGYQVFKKGCKIKKIFDQKIFFVFLALHLLLE